jgi:hypothetical protein
VAKGEDHNIKQTKPRKIPLMVRSVSFILSIYLGSHLE